MSNQTKGAENAGEKAFLEHLIELRDRLLRIVLVLGAIFICLTPFAQDLYNWLSDFLDGKDIQDIANQQWAGQYTDIIAQCITNKRLWIGVNVKTGTVELLTSPKSELLMVHSETPVEIWNRLPQDTRAYLTEQLDVLMKNNKGCYLLSKLERKMVYQSLMYIFQIIFSSCIYPSINLKMLLAASLQR